MRNRRPEVVRLLLQRNVDVDVDRQNSKGAAAIHVSRRDSTALLIEHGANVNGLNDQDESLRGCGSSALCSRPDTGHKNALDNVDDLNGDLQ